MDHLQATKLAITYFGKPELVDRMLDIYRTVMDYKSGHEHFGQGNPRRRALLSAASHGRRLYELLQKIDPRTLVELLGSTTYPLPFGERQLANPSEMGPHSMPGPQRSEVSETKGWSPIQAAQVSVSPMMVEDMGKFLAVLKHVHLSLSVAADRTEVQKRRPPLPDPLVFGVESLYGLWIRHSTRPPALSRNKGSFSDFAREFLSVHAKFDQTQLWTAVRQVLADKTLKTKRASAT